MVEEEEEAGRDGVVSWGKFGLLGQVECQVWGARHPSICPLVSNFEQGSRWGVAGQWAAWGAFTCLLARQQHDGRRTRV